MQQKLPLLDTIDELLSMRNFYFIADQDKREQQDQEKVEAWEMDQAALEQIVRRWGSRQVMTALAVIHQAVTQDRSKLDWRILSHAYLTGGYDDPNPCSCDDIF